ncbi:Uma2 family endonuclease [Polyangium sp. 15x6]|uniref:Uma2 family endonuclease n=1 Tax=Polyangium sp. 15x6 TaxID=3042687 RepID=UPI00249BC262|nr:Uma2 family endonuclease [Polyangium sp. 15x6]MDI3289456.1 Uma2 family endonuclease [Polyangium sp. 15x6]
MAPPDPGYVVDPNDPRAPSEETWARMSAEERARVVGMLPNEVPLGIFQPEGDPHRKAKNRALDALDTFFRKMGRRVYLSSDLAVYYPGEPMFSPDLLAVVDVDPHERMKWVVNAEGKGLDLVLEVHVGGDWVKDFEANVERYARLRIPEYFLFDRRKRSLRGYRLESPGARVYRPIVPQGGRWASEVLGLELVLEGERLRFYAGNAPLLEADELVVRLNAMVDDLVEKHLTAEAAVAEERKRADAAEAEKQLLAARLAEALAELEKLRGR